MSKIGSMSLYYSVGMLIIQYAHSSTVERKLAQLDNVLTAFDNVKDQVDSKLFLYQTPDMQWVPSTVYRYEDFRESLDVMATEGVAGKTFYVGEDVGANGYVYGLINIAAFLAQSMKETIQYDACDENSWDMIGGKYPLSNACGQLGQSYQDYHCSPEEAHMECKVDPNMSIKGVTNSKWYGAPGPMFCGSAVPRQMNNPLAGIGTTHTNATRAGPILLRLAVSMKDRRQVSMINWLHLPTTQVVQMLKDAAGGEEE